MTVEQQAGLPRRQEHTMNISFDVNVPPDVEERLRAEAPDLSAAGREAFAVDLFRRGILTHHGLRQTLGLDRFETDALLKRHRVTEQSLSHEDVDADVQSLDAFSPGTPDRTRPEGGVPRAEPRFCQDTARCGMLVDEERSRSIAGETAMVQPESKPTTMEFEPPQSDLLDPDGDGHSVARNAQGDDLEDEAVLRGVVAIDISREVAARFSGMLILNELPERQPEVVFDSGRQFRDDNGE